MRENFTTLESKIQKILRKFFSVCISCTLIIPLFVPWQNLSFSAEIKDEHFLAVLLVNEDLYTIGQEGNENILTGKIARYAQDIQDSTDNTKPLILPVPKDTTSEEIFRVLEKFYFEGQERGNKQFFLSSVVLIGDLALPEISTSVGSIPSVFPYTDFENPVFLWNSDIKIWEENIQGNTPEAEIFHGIISGTSEQISDFFDKNHATREIIKNGKISELVNDEIFFADFREEQKSLMIPLLNQYETRGKISEELVNYRYNSNLMSAITGNFLDNEVFSSGISEEEKALFNGEKSIYDNLNAMKESFKNSSAHFLDPRVQEVIKKFIPHYATVAEGFSREVLDQVSGTGRWTPESTVTPAELISQVDIFVGQEIKKMNDRAFENTKSLVSQMDSGVRVIDSIEQYVWDEYDAGGGGHLETILNYQNGLKMSEISDAKKCSLYRGRYGYENQYQNLDGSPKFLDDQAGLFLPDPLLGLESQQIEFNTLYDVVSLLGGGNPLSQCENLGQCCIKNTLSPASCIPSQAIQGVFSWNGSQKISKESEVLHASGQYEKKGDETSALACQNFAFNGYSYTNSSLYGYNYNLQKQKGLSFAQGKIFPQNIRNISSLVEHKEPGIGPNNDEKSLLTILKNPIAKHLPSNRVHYVDVLIGDDGMKKRVEHSAENFFRYKAKQKKIGEKSNAIDPAQTQYELSRVIFENQMKLIGGNSVYNRTTQPSEFSGIAQESAALKFHRIVKFKNGEMEIGHAFPVPDDFGKTGAEYEFEIAENFAQLELQGEIEKTLKKNLYDFLREMRTDKGPLSITGEDVVSAEEFPAKEYDEFGEGGYSLTTSVNGLFDLQNFFKKESQDYYKYSWDKKVADSIAEFSLTKGAYETLKKNNLHFVDVSRYYLHDFATAGFAKKNYALDAYLPSIERSREDGETEYTIETKNKYWTFKKLEGASKQENADIYYEIFEALAVTDDTLYETFPAGGRSFSGIRKNSGILDSKTSIYGEISGLNIPPQKTKKYLTHTRNASIGNRNGYIFSEAAHQVSNCRYSGNSNYNYYGGDNKISDTDFYQKNILLDNKCGLNQYFESYNFSGVQQPSLDSMYAHLPQKSEYSDFLFQWKDMNADEKHLFVMGLFLNTNDTRLVDHKNQVSGYAYSHLNLHGNNLIEWQEVPHNTEGLLHTNNSGNSGEDTSEDGSDENSDKENTDENSDEVGPCDSYVEDGEVPLSQWIPHVQCWLENVKNIDISAGQCGVVHSDWSVPEAETFQSIDPKLKWVHSIGFKTNGEIFPKNVQKTIQIQFVNGLEKIALGERVYFDVFVEGGSISPLVKDMDDTEEGVQLSTVLGKVNIPVIASGESETLKIIVNSRDGDSYDINLDTEKTFSVLSDGFIQITEYPELFEEDTRSQTKFYTLSAAVFSESAPDVKLENFQGDLYADTENSTRSYIANSAFLPDENFVVAVRGNAPVALSVTAQGMRKGDFILQKDGKPDEDESDNENAEHTENTENVHTNHFLTINRPEISHFSLNSLYATLGGLQKYNNFGEEHIANVLLHASKKTNVITTQIVAPEMPVPVATLFQKGGLQVQNKSYTPEISGLAPLRFSFLKANGVSAFADVNISGYEVEIENFSENSESDAENSGIEVQYDEASKKTSLLFLGELLFDIYESGSIIKYSNAFSLVLDTKNPEPTQIKFEVLHNENVVLTILLKNGKWSPVFSENNEIFIRDYSGKNINIFDPENTQTLAIFAEKQNSFEKNIFGAGFEEHQKFALQFASGNSVGESTKSSAGIFMVNFGDPFFKITPPEKNGSGFDNGVGTEILTRDQGDILKTFPIDIDGDGNDDIATVLTSGKVLFSTRYKNTFRNWGEGIQIDPQSKIFQAYDVNNDGFEGIIFTNTQGKVLFWENIEGVFYLQTSPEFFPEISLMSGEIFDADNDGFEDFGVVTTTGVSRIFYGNSDMGAQKFLEQRSTKISEIGFQLPEDLSNSLLINFEGITALPNAENFLFPLAYFSTQKNILESNIQSKKQKQENTATGEISPEISGSDLSGVENLTQNSHFLPQEKYFTFLSTFQNSFSVIKKTGKIIETPENSEKLGAGKRVQFTIELTSKDSDTIDFILGDAYSKMLKLDKSSIVCRGCGENFLGASYPNIAQAIIFENISLPPGKSLTITYEAEIAQLPDVNFSFGMLNGDVYADVILSSRNGKNEQVERYASTGARIYEKFVAPEKPVPDLPGELSGLYEDANRNGVPDRFETDSDGNNIPDFAEKIINGQAVDTNNDGTPDAMQEESGSLEKIGNALDTAIQSLAACGGGGCLSLPINYAFFVPGQMNLAKLESLKIGIESGPQPFVMTVFNAGPSGSFCVGPACFQPCPVGLCPIPFQQGFSISTFRFYLSPTLTGGMGVSVCTGPGGTTATPGGVCFIQAVSPDFMSGYCKEADLTSSLDSMKSSLGKNSSVFRVSGGGASSNTNDRSGITFDLSSIETSIPTSRNSRTRGDNILSNWVSRQMEEFKGMFTSLPSLTVYYPDVSGVFSISSYYHKDEFDDAVKSAKKNKWNGDTSVTAKTARKNRDGLQNTVSGAIEDGYDFLAVDTGAQDFLNDAEKTVESISDVYRILESVPLLKVERQPIVIYIPSLTKRELIQKIQELDRWIENAKAEIEYVKNLHKSLEGDAKRQWEEIVKSAETTLRQVQNLRKALDYYLNIFPELLQKFDTQIADYLYQLICYIDVIVEVVDGWTRRNKKRLEKWEEFVDTIPAIFEAFSRLPKIFTNYQSSCTTCHSGNYDSGTFEINIIGQIFPEIPVIRLPRLPDISLDISQINAAITVQVPELEFRARPIQLPNLPPLKLPRIITPNLRIPTLLIPTLPMIELPTLPQLPAIPIPKLPHLPAPPKIPNFMKDFGSIMSIVEKGLYLYCLIIRQSYFIHPESSAMSVVESLTARPLKPLSIDFLSLQLPEISLPSISEIRVEVQTNLEQDSSIVLDSIKDFADDLNKKTYDMTNLSQVFGADYSNYLDFSQNDKVNELLDGLGDSFDEANDALQEGGSNWNNGVKNFDQQNQEGVDDALKTDEIQQQLDEAGNDAGLHTLQNTKNLNNKLFDSLLSQNVKNLKQKILKNRETLVDISEVRKSLGLSKWRSSQKRIFTGKKYSVLRKKVVALQERTHRRQQNFLASGNDISVLLKNTTILASRDKKTGKSYSYIKPEISTQVSPASVSSEVPNITAQNLISTLEKNNGPAEIDAPAGIFLGGKDGGVYPLLAYEKENDFIRDFFFLKTENSERSGVSDLIYTTPYSVFLKKDRSLEPEISSEYSGYASKNSYAGVYQVEKFQKFLPVFQAPKNLKSSGEGNKISLTVFPESKEFVSGVMYIKDISVFSEHREYGKNIDHLAFSGEKREYIIRVKKSLFDDLTENLGYKSDEFFPVSELSDQLKSDWKIRENSRIMISRFDSLSTEIFIDLGKTYTIASKWITPAQKVGNLSDHILVSNIPSDDHSAPLVLDSFEKVAYLYKKNRISLSNILDLGGNDVMLEWDTDNNGSYETSGNSFLTEVYREPFSEKIPVKISDASGNFTETFVTIIYKAPPVFLNDIDDIQKISGYISPKYAGAPVTLLRERYGQTKKIITDSLVKTQGDEFFTTDEDGKFLVQNIDLSPNVWIRDKAGNVIGEVLAHTGKLVSRDEKYHVDLIEGKPEKSGNNNNNRMRQVLLDTNNTIVANALVHTFSENSVQKISKTSGFTEENTQFSGSYVLDTNPSDSIVSGLLPLVAPENSGGRVIFDKISGKSLAHIFRDGNIIFFPNSDLKIQLSDHHNNEEKNLIIDVYQKNTKIFEVMLVTNEVKNTENNSEKIEINRNTNMGGALAFFSPENFPEFQKPLLSALDSTLKLQLPFSDVDKNSEYYEPLAELFSRNLISGYEDGTFQPDKKISRAEFVKIALGVTHCLDCLNPSDAEKSVFYEVNSFPDVQPQDWFDFCVSKAKKLTMVQGYGDGFFKPNNSISRAEAVAILIRQVDIPLQVFATKPMIDVPDYAWYKNSVITALNLGLIEENYGYVFPDEEITRGEFAKMASLLFSIRDCHFLDSDGDGLPDYLEVYNGLNPNDASDREGVNRADLVDPKNNAPTKIPDGEDEETNEGEEGNAGNNEGDNEGNAGNNEGDNEGNAGNNEGDNFVITPDSEDDLCPFVPEDFDSVDDEDGCPETSGENEENSSDEYIIVIPGDPKICGFIDYRAQIRKGDTLYAAIVKDDDSEIFSESQKRGY